MTLLRQILHLFVVLLFSALGASMAFSAPMVTSDNAYFQAESTHFAQADDIGFAARAPPLAAANVDVTGGVTVKQGSAFALHGQETVAALFGFDAGLNATNRTQLIDDLVAGGTRITPENVVDIRSVNGRTVWLETGNSRAGLQHITDGHAQDFANRGVTQGQIPDLIFNALERGQVVGTAGTGRNLRSIYEVDFNGVTQRIGIGVSDNGFIVTAHPG